MVKVKLTQSMCRPGQAHRVPRVWGSQISWQSSHEGGNVSPTHRPPLPPPPPPGIYSRYLFLLEAESTPEPWCGRKDYVSEKFQWCHRESNPRPFGTDNLYLLNLSTNGMLFRYLEVYNSQCMDLPSNTLIQTTLFTRCCASIRSVILIRN
jgi:hypothetical protein